MLWDESKRSRVGMRCDVKMLTCPPAAPLIRPGFVVADWGHKIEVQFLDGTCMEFRDGDPNVAVAQESPGRRGGG